MSSLPLKWTLDNAPRHWAWLRGGVRASAGLASHSSRKTELRDRLDDRDRVNEIVSYFTVILKEEEEEEEVAHPHLHSKEYVARAARIPRRVKVRRSAGGARARVTQRGGRAIVRETKKKKRVPNDFNKTFVFTRFISRKCARVDKLDDEGQKNSRCWGNFRMHDEPWSTSRFTRKKRWN